MLEFNSIEEAKALLNTAAADCLQKIRLDSSNKEEIDINILSDKKLGSIGYKIDPASKKCSNLMLIPTNSEDELRYPIGFLVGKINRQVRVTKTATPTTTDEGSIRSCENWAGNNCNSSGEMQELFAYNSQIQDAKTKCENQYTQWMNSNGNGPVNRWNPSADSACSTRPPKVVSATCTPNGCNRKVYALDGRIVGNKQEDYNNALEAKYGRICTEKVEGLRQQSPPFTNPEETPITFTECGTKGFWFHKGTEVASATEWRGLMCSNEVSKNINETKVTKLEYCGNKNYYFCGGKDQLSQDNWDTCIANNKEAKCLADRENARKDNYQGKYQGVAGPGQCGQTVWMCDKKILASEADYEATSCGTPPCVVEYPALCATFGGRWCDCQ